tara:strand:- start:536 stop:790 length:255 start_codon:yes stop_codon:yes gene_type:complete
MAEKPEGGVAIFVLGLLGMLLCQVLGIIAWVQGNTYMQKCRNLGVEPEGIAVAGRILGMISSILFILSLVGILIALIIPAVSSQ